MADALTRVLSYLPPRMREEILRVGTSHSRFAERLTEIRLRGGGVSSLTLAGQNLALATRVDMTELAALLYRLCDGSLYAFRDPLSRGYLPLGDGIRVGVCGRAGYDGERSVGISDIRSLVFRLPHGVCDSEEVLLDVWRRGIGCGMLIYSPPGVGKTTALRALARRIGTGPPARRVCVIDERCEFVAGELSLSHVDLLQGYRREEAIEIATRTLSPELLIVDEIGGEREARAMLSVLRCGIPLIATAHASTVEEARARPTLAPFFASGIFEVLVGLSVEGGVYRARVDRLTEAPCIGGCSA